jgi:hypothetical protein
MNGAAELGESDLDYLTAVLELAVAVRQQNVHSGWPFEQTL